MLPHVRYAVAVMAVAASVAVAGDRWSWPDKFSSLLSPHRREGTGSDASTPMETRRCGGSVLPRDEARPRCCSRCKLPRVTLSATALRLKRSLSLCSLGNETSSEQALDPTAVAHPDGVNCLLPGVSRCFHWADENGEEESDRGKAHFL